MTRIVNTAATFTVLGGSRMPPEVLAAMADAAEHHVDMHELHLAAGRRLAEATRNPAAYVTAGCAAGIVLGVLAARTGGDPSRISQWPGTDDVPSEVIMHAAHRIPYDSAVSLAGGRIRQIGNVLQTFAWELEGAIGPSTAAILYVVGAHLPPSALPLDEVVEIAHRHDIPVIVDAAAQLPPVDNLWRLHSEFGADLVLFSGGKALRGPQTTGLMVGSATMVEAARQSGSPYQRWARAMKVGKEEIAGLVAAVERFVDLDFDELRAGYLNVAEAWATALSELAGVHVSVESTNEAGQPIPRVHVRCGDPQRLRRAFHLFASGTPRLAVYPDLRNGTAQGFWVTPELSDTSDHDFIIGTIVRGLTADPWLVASEATP